MLHTEREQEILSILKTANGFVTVRQLCDRLFASESSIRRDLKILEQRGLVKRSYGGAAPTAGFSNIVTFHSRTRQNVEAKRQIARKAAALIQDGMVVFLDQSSTAFYLANEIMHRSTLTVVTNNIEIMMLLSHSALRLIASGGLLSGENRNCLIGGDAQKTFSQVYGDILFFSVKGLMEDGTVTDCDREEILVREVMLHNADKRVLLCDSTKFGVRAPFVQCVLPEVDVLISEGDCARRFAAFEKRTCLL